MIVESVNRISGRRTSNVRIDEKLKGILAKITNTFPDLPFVLNGGSQCVLALGRSDVLSQRGYANTP